MTETLACGYSSESTEYQHDKMYMVFKILFRPKKSCLFPVNLP